MSSVVQENVKRIILNFITLILCFLGNAQTSVKSFYFESSFSIPTEYSQKQLELFKQKLDKKEIIIDKVYAFTDSAGSIRYNDSLAKRRLEYVVYALDLKNSNTIPKVAQGLNRIDYTHTVLNWRRVDVYYQEIVTPEEQEQQMDSLDTKYSASRPQLIDTKHQDIYESADNSTPYILNVEFFEGTANLEKKSHKEIQHLADFLTKNGSVNIVIRGHVCCGKNMRISKKRAKSVYQELVHLGISKKRLSYIGMSNSEPIVTPELNDRDRQRNRRVDVQFIGL